MRRISSLLLLGLLIAAALSLVAGASPSSSKDSKDLVFFLFTKQCYAKFMSGDLFDVACLRVTVSKLLGYGIIAGACIVKLPQIIAFLRTSSVAGVSRNSTYFEVVGYLLQSIYHIRGGSPFSAYGETVIVAVQALVVVLMIWAYAFPGTLEVAIVVGALGAVAQQALSTAPSNLVYVQSMVTLLFIVSRFTQIVANVKQGGTGALAFLTLFMNLAGSAARIFTSSVEVKDKPEVLVSFVVSTVLNAILVGQYVWYRLGSGAASAGKSKAAAAVSDDKKQASASASGTSKKSQAAASEDDEGAASTSSGGARPRRAAAARKQA